MFSRQMLAILSFSALNRNMTSSVKSYKLQGLNLAAAKHIKEWKVVPNADYVLQEAV